MQLIRNEAMTYAQKRTNLEIEEISYGALDPEWNIENLQAAFTRIYLPLAGEGMIRYGDQTVHLLPRHIYVVPSGLSFSAYCPNKLEKLYVHLTLTHPDGTDLFYGMDSCIVLPDGAGRIERIAALYHADDVTSILRLKLLLYEILYEALAHTSPRKRQIKPYSDCTKAAISYIDSHLSASLTIADMASALFVSKLVLQKNFKADVGKPLGRYMDDCIMMRAERALLDPSRSIKEISEQLGFCDQFYFSRKFSQAHGISPRRFRQMHLQ